MAETGRGCVACILIDNLMPGENRLSGLLFHSALALFPFMWQAGAPMMDALRTLLQRARRACGAATVLARGTGCGAALALAEQLPVERLALIEPAGALEARRGARTPGRETDAAERRQIRRTCAFARRNLALCVSDALVIEGGRSRGWQLLNDGGLSAHSRLCRLAIPAESGEILFTNCENSPKRALIDFLAAGELPKDLAENREMCIMYR